jgi:hypothetical protein
MNGGRKDRGEKRVRGRGGGDFLSLSPFQFSFFGERERRCRGDEKTVLCPCRQ